MTTNLLKGFGQFLEDFSDSDYTTNPVWKCNLSEWKVEAGKLRSTNGTPNTTFGISTNSGLVKGTEWRFTTELQFNTSSLNYVDVFLVSDDSNLVSGAKNGYYVRIGGTKDEICLYKKTDGTSVLLIDGADGSTDKSSNLVSVSVQCSDHFEWNLKRSFTDNFLSLESEGTAIDSSISSSDYFGICISQSTTSFIGKHYFDNISAQKIVADSVAPFIVSAKALNERKIVLELSEELGNDPSNLKQLFKVSDSTSQQVTIDSIVQDLTDPKSYLLYLSKDLDGRYQLICNGLQDISGNRTKEDQAHTFLFYKPAQINYRNILFSEFLPDPTPSIGLPEAEFIELSNNTNLNLDLGGCSISDPSLTVAFPSFTFLANTYLILCRKEDSVAFSKFGNVLAFTSLPSLNNSSDQLWLRNAKGLLIDRVAYTTDWYKDKNKEEGGYSLELIDPKDDCRKGDNWQASINILGGTPGRANSVQSTFKDTTIPSILNWKLISPTFIEITYSETLDSLIYSLPNFSLTEGLMIKTIQWKSDSLQKARFELEKEFPYNQPITLHAEKLRDCPGNEAHSIAFSLIRPLPPLAYDLLINELLFNPRPYGVDFVELYNNSPRHIDLQELYLASIEDDSIANIKTITTSSFILKPFEYIVLTTNKNTLLNHYPKGKADRILQVPSLPTYGDKSGNVVLINSFKTMIDRFDYEEGMQSPLLSDKEGVSLEKIDPRLPSNDRNNWMSASKEVGYATPGYQNSQLLLLGTSGEIISIEPLVITPNGDGDKDFLLIQLRTEQIAQLNTVIIYDAMGTEVRRLVKNQFGGVQTHVQWDGTNEQQEPVALGHYIIWVEMVDKEGKVIHAKKKAVVGGKF